MNSFWLSEELTFPPLHLATKDGLVSMGGDLSVERLLLAYTSGIFPWYSEGEPILWWSPDPRLVLLPQDIQISKSMQKLLRKNKFNVTYDRCFKDVITMCRNIRTHKQGTWITDEILEAYFQLHKLGFVHSVEIWFEEKLVGGLYGVSIGKCFFGESMFSIMDNASKVAFITLAKKLLKKNFLFIDCQVYSKHLETLGAKNISRDEFLVLLKKGLSYERKSSLKSF